MNISYEHLVKKGNTYFITVGDDESGYGMFNHNDIVFKSCQTATHMR